MHLCELQCLLEAMNLRSCSPTVIENARSALGRLADFEEGRAAVVVADALRKLVCVCVCDRMCAWACARVYHVFACACARVYRVCVCTCARVYRVRVCACARACVCACS